MTQNRAAFESLLSGGLLRVRRGVIFDERPAPLPDSFSYAKVEGMMNGLAIANALGSPTEGLWPSGRRGRR